MKSSPTKKHPFHELEPDMVLSLVEKQLGILCTNLFRPLTSYINKVYELERKKGGGLIVKFYRPGRWTDKALLEEHAFLHELAAQEIAVVAPMKLADGSTLGVDKGLRFAIFAKRGGRSYDEYSDDQWLEIGRLLGRVHSVGAVRPAKHRQTMGPDASAAIQLRFLLAGQAVPEILKNDLAEICEEVFVEIRPMFAGIENIRIHGDCHFANILHRPGESFLLIDFDDMVMGPPVQDLWMLLPDLPEKSLYEIDLFLEGYETFRAFDRRTLSLIEPLRAMRFIHYQAWCAHQTEDLNGPPTQDWGSLDYWRQELADLEDQLTRIRETREFGNW